MQDYASADVTALALTAVETQITRLEAGRLRLRLPRRGSARSIASQHRHSYPELGIYLAGRSTLTAGDETIVCRAGDVLLVPSGVPHREDFDRVHGSACVLFHHWNRTLGYHLTLPADAPGGWRMVNTHIIGHGGTVALAHRLDEVADAAWRRGLTHASCRGLLLAWFGEVSAALAAAPQPTRVPLVEACRHLIARHATVPGVGVAWLAQRLGCHPDHLGRSVRTAAGSTVQALIDDQRLSLAEQLLAEEGGLRVARIATTCGFTSSAYFCRWFLRKHGVAPGAWRRRARAFGGSQPALNRP